MITLTLRENKRSLQPTAEAGDLKEIALCQVLRLLFGLLPGSKQVMALITPTQFPAWVNHPARCKKLCPKNFPTKRSEDLREVGRGKTS